jgi:hypothetical protein
MSPSPRRTNRMECCLTHRSPCVTVRCQVRIRWRAASNSWPGSRPSGSRAKPDRRPGRSELAGKVLKPLAGPGETDDLGPHRRRVAPLPHPAHLPRIEPPAIKEQSSAFSSPPRPHPGNIRPKPPTPLGLAAQAGGTPNRAGNSTDRSRKWDVRTRPGLSTERRMRQRRSCGLSVPSRRPNGRMRELAWVLSPPLSVSG